jgi:hypothetical protein
MPPKQSMRAKQFEMKAVAFAEKHGRSMVTSVIWEKAQNAACMLWEESEQLHSSMYAVLWADPEQVGHWMEKIYELQDLSLTLYQNPHMAVMVEARLNVLGHFVKTGSSLQVRDAVAWQVVAMWEETTRNTDQSAQTPLQKQKALERIVTHLCPDIAAHVDRRSMLVNAVHKNFSHLMRIGQHLTSAYDVPSASQVGAGKKRRTSKKAAKQAEDIDSSDCASLLAEASDAERRAEVDIADEFRMASHSSLYDLCELD